MKLTIKEKTERTVTAPPYFKKNGFDNCYYMAVGELTLIEVTDHKIEIDSPFSLYPQIRIESINYINFDSGVTPISEAEFKLAYTRVSLAIEKLLN
jgi:hypothetical protein